MVSLPERKAQLTVEMVRRKARRLGRELNVEYVHFACAIEESSHEGFSYALPAQRFLDHYVFDNAEFFCGGVQHAQGCHSTDGTALLPCNKHMGALGDLRERRAIKHARTRSELGEQSVNVPYVVFGDAVMSELVIGDHGI